MADRFKLGDFVRVHRIVHMEHLNTLCQPPAWARLISDMRDENTANTLDWQCQFFGKTRGKLDNLSINERDITLVPDDEVPDWIWVEIATRSLLGEDDE